MHLSQCSSSPHELSCILDTTLNLFGEFQTSARSLFPCSLLFGIGKFSGPCYFFKAADSDEFWSSIDTDNHQPDGVYGWSMVVENPVLQATPLPGRHAAILNSQESLHRMAEAVMSLYRQSQNRPQRQRNTGSILLMTWWNVSKLLC